MELYDNIRKRRKQLKLTQEELAKKLGYDRSTIAKIESGAVDIPTSKILEFAKALEIEASELVGYGEEKILSYDPREHELLELFGKLKEEDKLTVMNLVRSLANK